MANSCCGKQIPRPLAKAISKAINHPKDVFKGRSPDKKIYVPPNSYLDHPRLKCVEKINFDPETFSPQIRSALMEDAVMKYLRGDEISWLGYSFGIVGEPYDMAFYLANGMSHWRIIPDGPDWEIRAQAAIERVLNYCWVMEMGFNVDLGTFEALYQKENIFMGLLDRICFCEKDCPHMKQCDFIILTQPEILSTDEINEMAQKTDVLMLGHLFNPEQLDGKVTFESWKPGHKLKDDQIKNKITISSVELLKWTRKGNSVRFTPYAQREIEHEDIFSGYYTTNMKSDNENFTKIIDSINFGSMKLAVFHVQGKFFPLTPSCSDSEILLLCQSTKLNDAMLNDSKDRIDFIDSENGQMIFIKKIGADKTLIHFSVGSLSTALKIKFKKWFNMDNQKATNILSNDYYDFLTAFTMELPSQVVKIDVSLYNTMLDAAESVDFTDLNQTDTFRQMVARFISLKVSNPLTVRTLCLQIMKDVAFNKIITHDLVQSNFMKLLKEECKTGNEIGLFSKLLAKLTNKKVDTQFNILKEEQSKIEKPKPPIKTAQIDHFQEDQLDAIAQLEDISKRSSRLLTFIEKLSHHLRQWCMTCLLRRLYKNSKYEEEIRFTILNLMIKATNGIVEQFNNMRVARVTLEFHNYCKRFIEREQAGILNRVRDASYRAKQRPKVDTMVLNDIKMELKHLGVNQIKVQKKFDYKKLNEDSMSYLFYSKRLKRDASTQTEDQG